MKTNTSSNTSSPRSLHFWFLTLLVLSFITLIVHAYLSGHGYNLKLGLESGQSLCNVSAKFNCDNAAVSRYANFFGIPMAILGLLTQLALIVFLLGSHWGLSQFSDLLRRLTFWLSLFVAAVSVVMAGLSAFSLGSYCPFCLLTYLLSFLSLFAAFKFQTENPLPQLSSDLSLLFSTVRWPLVILLLIPGLGFVSNSVILNSYGYGKMDLIIQDSLVQWEQSPVYEFKPEPGLTLNPTSKPKMTIVEFADFLCPHCKTASPVLHAFVQSHPDTQLIFKNFPLDGKCNKGIQQPGDGFRCKLAGSVICAAKLFNKGWEFHHWFFENQENLGPLEKFPQSLEQVSQKYQVSSEEITKCLEEDLTLEAIQASAQEGINANIQGTPSVFVNGKSLPRGQLFQVLDAAYRKLNP